MDPRTAVYKRYWVDFLFLLPFRCRSTKHKASQGQLKYVGKPILRSSAVRHGWVIGRSSSGNQKFGSWIQRTSGRLCLVAVSLATNRFEGGWAGEMVSKHSRTAGRVYSHAYLRGSLGR